MVSVMRKFLIGLACGIGLSATTVVYASDTIQAYLFPVKYLFNGQNKELSNEYATLNYNGHVYLPIRFISENLGAVVQYDEGNKTIIVDSNKSEFYQLDEISDNINKFRSKIEEMNSIKLSYIYMNQNHEIEIEYRKTGDFERQLTGQEIAEIRNSIFNILGTKFPLVLNQYYIKEANIIGTIQEIDKNNKKILIVDDEKKLGQSENPESVWVKLTDDAKIVSNSAGDLKTIDDLQIGQKVKSWFYGAVLESYPSQTESVKIEILGM
jgi:hypothetical protein